MGLLSKRDAKLITDPLSDNNPITVQVLGICSALAITAELEASVVMSVSVLFVMGVGNVVISMIRNIIPEAKIAVCDNNSNDATVSEALSKKVEVYSESRKGKGYAVSKLFRSVESEIYVMVDGDNTCLLYTSDAADE